MTAEEEQKLAKSLGFECVPDKGRGGEHAAEYGWCYFVKGNTLVCVKVWKTREGWTRANQVNGYFRDHRFYKTLEEALKDEGEYTVPLFANDEE